VTSLDPHDLPHDLLWSSSLLPGWCYRIFLCSGFIIIFWSQYALALAVIGKLSVHIEKLARGSGKAHVDNKT